MSFGFSIGDFITVIELAKKLRKKFVGAPSQFKHISDEVRSLSIVLQDVDIVLSERELSSEWKSELKDIADGCHNVLDTLEKTLDKYGELNSNPKVIGKNVKRVWKRLKWEPEDIQELRSRISSNITLLNTFLGRLSRDKMVELVRHKDDQERRTILDWLSPVDYAAQQSDFLSRRRAGTGQWLLNSTEFQKWLKAAKQTLFCPGIPGAGKTIITSIVVEDLSVRYQNDSSIGIAYLYCNFRRQHEQKIEDLLASLLKQFIQEQPSIPDSVNFLYNRHKEKRTRPSFEDISKVLDSVTATYPRTFIIVDALDECQATDGCRARFLSEIFKLQAWNGTNIFATSRFIPEIVQKLKKFGGSVSLEIRARNADVRTYLDGRVSQLPGFVARSPELQEEIKSEIVKAVDGMFLLSQLHFDSLIGMKSPKAVRTALKKLPKGSNAYDCAYREAMERIQGQVPSCRELAEQVLSWVICATRLLATSELRHALAVEVGEPELDEENLPEIEDIVSVCAGLVTVDKESDIVRLAHYTTQEYFERTWTSWFPNAQTDITSACVTYLSFDAFKTGICQTDEAFEERLRSNVLYDYTARNWGHHARTASTESERLVLNFLENEAKVSASVQAVMALRGYCSGYSQMVPNQVTGVHLAAYLGFRDAVMALLKKGYGPDVKDSNGSTPLSYAAESGHEAVVKLLFKKGANIDSEDSHGRTPLWLAAKSGHKGMVKLLLKNGAHIDSKDSYFGRVPLSWAAGMGHEAAVKLLLENGANIDSKDSLGRTPLSLAAESGHEGVVKLLLEKGAQIDSKDSNCGRVPLSWAAGEGHEAVVKLLLEKGADIDSKDSLERTPLTVAAFIGREAVVKLLLEKGASIDSKDSDGRTPLSHSILIGCDAVVKLLLEKGADIDSKDSYGRTALMWAAWMGHSTTVKLLLEKGANIDTKCSDGRTALRLAAEYEHEAVVKLLLEKGANIDSKDSDEGTPLLGTTYIRPLLAEYQLDSEGLWAVMVAKKYGFQEPIKVVLEKGTNVRLQRF